MSMPDSSMISSAHSQATYDSTAERLSEPTSAHLPSKIRAFSTWEHARPPRDGEPERQGRSRKWYCKYCQDYSCTSTSGARHHLQSKHGISIEAEDRKIMASSDKSTSEVYERAGVSQPKAIQHGTLKETLDKKLLKEALISLIVSRNLPYRAVEWPELHALLRTANPAITSEVISSHTTVSTAIHSSWLVSKDNVRKRLQPALSKIHLTADVWTSPNQILFLGVCAHFVDRETQRLSKALLGLRPLLSHRGDDQAAEIFPLLEEFGLKAKLGCFVGDNHGSNDVACRALSSFLKKDGISWDPVQHRLRCNGHIINLAVQAFLFKGEDEVLRIEEGDNDERRLRGERWRQCGVLGKLHNIAVHTRSSPARRKEFHSLADRGLPLDNETRWNSWYKMLEVALQVSPAIDTYLKKWLKDLGDDYLSPNDWKLLGCMESFLKVFHRATMETQGDQARIDRVLWSMDILVSHYERSISLYASNPLMHDRILRSWSTFDKYYKKTDDTPIYAAALILHPSQKTQYIKKVWKKEWQKPALAHVKKLWEAYQGSQVLDHSTPDFFDLKYNSNDQALLELDEFDIIAREHKTLTQNPVKEDEYDRYIKASTVQIQGSALEWWLSEERRDNYPTLSQFAIDILSIPAMSDEPERIFSGARRTVSWSRMRLGPDMIEKTECMKSWMRGGLATGLIGSGAVLTAESDDEGDMYLDDD